MVYFFATGPYSQRVQHMPSGGIVLSNVTVEDAGNYTVVANANDAGGARVTYRYTTTVHVATVSTARTDATLEVRQEPTAVYDNQTGQFHVQLTCTSQGRQPSAVIWTTPSQQTLPSYKTEGDTFSLLLANPVTGGNYTCRLPPDSPAAKCLPANDPALEGATVRVEKTEARLALLETENGAMKAEDSAMKAEISAMKAEDNVMKAEINDMKVYIRLLQMGVGIRQVRLRRGGSNYGRVEVLPYGKNTWGTVCDDGWDNNDAKVICRMLGYSGSSATAYGGARYGQGSGDIYLDNVDCRGGEANINLCRHNGISQHNCEHKEDASVYCG